MSVVPRAIPIFLSGLLIFALFVSGIGAAAGLRVLAEPSVELIFGLAGRTAVLFVGGRLVSRTRREVVDIGNRFVPVIPAHYRAGSKSVAVDLSTIGKRRR